MNIIPAYRDFSAGEISPLMRDRQDVDTHNAAVATMRNMVPDAHGPAKTRNGTKYLATIPAVTEAVLRTFRVRTDKYWNIIVASGISYGFDNLGVPSFVPTFSTPAYTTSELKDIHFAEFNDSLSSELLLLHKNYPSEHFVIFPIGSNSLTQGPVTWFSPPAYWGSAAGTYPAKVTTFGGRLWTANGNLFWVSKPQNKYDMATGITEADGFELEMEDAGEIKWLSKSNGLVVGTDFGEYVISSQGNVIYIGDKAINLQSEYGSKSVQPVVLGDKLGFISGDGRKLYATQYDDNSLTWIPIEISFFSEHITEGGIKSFIYNPYPDNLAWFVKENGDFISALYNRSVNVYGWSRHDTNGTVVSISTGKINGVNEVVSLVVRNGVDTFLEVESSIPLDSHIHYSGVATVTITGLGHLEGMEVHALTDGYYGGVYTVASGQITLDQEASDVYVGLSFEQELELLPVDKGSQRGSGRTHLKRYKDIFVGILNSYYPEINGETPQDITPDVVMDAAPDLITGMVNITDLGYDRESNISIKQSLPFPLTVTGIFGTLTQEKL